MVGRKRWLFIGHPDAGWRSAVIYTIIQSCRRRGINPQEYLTDVLGRLPSMKNHEVKDVLPSRWKPCSSQTAVGVAVTLERSPSRLGPYGIIIDAYACPNDAHRGTCESDTPAITTHELKAGRAGRFWGVNLAFRCRGGEKSDCAITRSPPPRGGGNYCFIRYVWWNVVLPLTTATLGVRPDDLVM